MQRLDSSVKISKLIHFLNGEDMKKKRSKRNQKEQFPVIVLILGLLLVAAAVILVVQNNNATNVNQNLIERITPAEAQEAVANGNAVLLDVRSQAAYDQLHAEGAVNIPLDALPSRLDELDPQKWVITYCT